MKEGPTMRCSLGALCLLLLPLIRAPGPIAAQELPEIFPAILEGDAAGVEAALDSGVDPNPTVEERTPLMFAVWRKQMEIVELLVARGADLDGETALGVPLIHIAAEVGSVEMLTYPPSPRGVHPCAGAPVSAQGRGRWGRVAR